MIEMNVDYEKLREIPKEINEKFFLANDDKNLEINNESFSEVYLIKLEDGEKRDINFDFKQFNGVAKVILLIGEGCNVNIRKIVRATGENVASIDFLTLVDKNSKVNMNDLVFSKDYSRIEFFERVFSLREGNNIKINAKAISKDKSKTFFEAFAFVDKNSGKSKFNIKEEGIIFDNSKLEFLPKLKIENNEVTAGHSAFIKKFNENDLFYLMSRGLNLDGAQKLLLEGFLSEFEIGVDEIY